MIDKDAAERKAIIDSGFNFFLCHFHNLETWNERIGKHFKNAPDKNEMKEKIISWINEVQRSLTEQELQMNETKFFEKLNLVPNSSSLRDYFKDNWFCENWRDSWTDLHRIGCKGLYNTNNLTET